MDYKRTREAKGKRSGLSRPSCSTIMGAKSRKRSKLKITEIASNKTRI